MGRLAPLCGAAMVLCASLGGAAAPAGGPEHVWWEGERPAETNFPKKTWFSPSSFRSRAHLLSEGDWLTHQGNRTGPEAFARYPVDVPSAGTWNLWCRKFWKHGPFRWRFGSQAWQTCGRDVALADNTYLRTHVGANWVYLGKVRLPAGKQTFELRLLAKEGEGLTACFDCFCLIRGAFLPNGKLKPGERSGQADEGRFAYEPGIDPFRADALLDLRHLNEKTAGAHGHVRRKAARFVRGDGEPVRFFAVNVSSSTAAQARDTVDYLARRLAKLGVNMVRFHSALFDRRADDPARIDRKKLDDLHYLIAAMKRQGIYTKVSFYFPLWFDVKPSYGIAGFEAMQNKRPFALLYFEPRMQQIHRSWARALLTTPNPYTRLPIAADPAVAIVEIINEDSYFFWTFGKRNIPPVHWQRLEKLYGQWLAKNRGPAAVGRAQLLDAWHMTAGGLKQGGAAKVQRMRDQVAFLAEHQRRFYADTVSYFKKDLGYRGLVSCSNWHTADPALLDAVERYTYTAGDVIDRHGYFGGAHKGDGAGYSVRTGHTFTDLAAVRVPERLPIRVHQHENYPHIISELGWTNPNRFRADCTFLSAAYGGLQGIDGLFLFAAGKNTLSDLSMGKFQLGCPAIAGTFPAAAVLYRRGDVAEAEPCVRQVLRLDDLYAMKCSGAMTDQALDKLRQADIPAGGKATGAVSMLDPLSFYVGRVVRTLGDDPTASTQRDLTKYIDRVRKTVRSLTGEVQWDYGVGLVRVSTPRSQGAAGMLSAAGKIKLGDVTIESGNEYAAVLVVALDDQPIATSRKILIQAMTEERPYGFRASGGRITALGSAPFGVRKIAAAVSLALKGSGKITATALDENGYATKKKVVVTGGGAGTPLQIRLPEDAIYVIVQRP